MSLPVATTISGIDSMRVLKQNLRIAVGFKPLTQRADGAAPSPGRARVAADGRFELYKTTARARRGRRPRAARIPAADELSSLYA